MSVLYNDLVELSNSCNLFGHCHEMCPGVARGIALQNNVWPIILAHCP